MRWLLPVVLAACVTEHAPVEPQVTTGAIYKDLPISVDRRSDVLFVIDNGPAMEPYAANVRANLARFIESLNIARYGVPDLRLAVVAGDGTSLETTPGMLGEFAVDFVGPDTNRVRNYDGDLSDVFARLSDVGTSATASQPFIAARMALEHPTFVRHDAMTFVFVVSAADEPPIEGEKLAVFLRALHNDPDRVAVVGIAPDGAAGITALLQSFLRRARGAIDDPDWASKVFSIIPMSYRSRSLPNPCFDGPLVDLDGLKPGLQPACSAEYRFPIGGEIVPPCVGDLVGTHCFRIVSNERYCTFGSSQMFVVEQPRADIPEGTHLFIQCLSRYDE